MRIPNRTHIPGLGAPVLYKLLLWEGGGQGNKFLLKNPSVLLALIQILVIWVFHFESFVIVTPRYSMHLMLSAFSNTVSSGV